MSRIVRIEAFRAFSIQVLTELRVPLTELRAPSIVRFLHNGWEAADIFLNRKHSSRKRSNVTFSQHAQGNRSRLSLVYLAWKRGAHNGLILSSLWNGIAAGRAFLFELRNGSGRIGAYARQAAGSPACGPPDCGCLPGAGADVRMGCDGGSHTHGGWVLRIRRFGRSGVSRRLDRNSRGAA